MLIAPKADNEAARIKAINDLQILDTPINPVFERITRITKAIFGVPIVAISIIDSERQWFKSTQGLNVCQNDLNTSFCAHAILQDDVFIVQDPLQDPRFNDNPLVTGDPKIRFYAGCPILTEDGYKVGTLCIIDNKERKLDPQDITQLKDMAALAQDELQKYKVKHNQSEIIKELDQVKRSKLIDGLTGVWNREGSQINIQEQMTLARANSYSFILGILDIDNFKNVNDTYGHNTGDDVIREVVKRMVINLNEHNIIGRWGGEEFILIAKVIDSTEKVLAEIEAARASIAAEPIISGANQVPASITIGLTNYGPHSEETIEQLVNKADMALYQGKHSGKNQCVVDFK